MQKNPLWHLLRDPVRRGVLFLYGGALFHFLYGSFRLFAGILYRPYHTDVASFFYLSLAASRLFLIRAYPKRSDAARVREACRLSGRVLFVALGIMLLLIAETVVGGRLSPYPRAVVWISGAYAISAVALAVAELFVLRRLKSPLLSVSRAVGMTAALLSGFTFLCDLLFAFSLLSEQYRQALTVSVGAAILLFVAFFALSITQSASNKKR